MSVKELSKSNPQGLIGRAYFFAEKAHDGQKRQNGEPYFNHVLATGEALNQWQLDEQTIAAGLLHDTVEDCDVPIETIKKEFGEDVSFLVDGVTKLGRIKYRGEESKVENMRKMILAISQDLRVVFIKLADRSHNMKTLGALPPQKQKRVAMETDELYAPLAYRLGMQNVSGELHDLALPYIHPKESSWLEKTAVEQYEIRTKYLEKIRPLVEDVLKKHDIIPVAIDFRAKRRSSLYKKLLRYDMDIERIYDLVAMRIILKDIAECYAVLGIIHEEWPPLPGRIKDYIAMPKPNGYRSLHTTVIGPEDKKVEIQIRTQEMHDENENGIAAHWLYQQKKSGKGERANSRDLTKELTWVQQLRNWVASQLPADEKEKQTEGAGPVESQGDARGASREEFMETMKFDFFKDRIFAVTPHGDVVDLPYGSTPVDFAYSIHGEIGDTCVGAKVNDQIVPLSYELKSGDVVQILTQKNKKPSEAWLKFVKTSVARSHIKTASRDNLTRKDKPSKAEIRITVDDRMGIVKDISTIISRSHVNIISFSTQDLSGGGLHTTKAEVATADKQKIEKLLLKLKGVKGVREVGYKLV